MRTLQLRPPLAALATGATALLAMAVVTSAAAGDGLPVVDVNTQAGVIAPGGSVRYVALPAEGDTVVARLARDDAAVLRSRSLDGRFAVPAVAYDGTTGGLSADESTLILIRPRVSFPRQRTTFAVLDAERLRPRDVVTLRGDFSYDALSPDGSLLYLVEYTSRQDYTQYRVRAYDLEEGRLLPRPVVDPANEGAEMRGYPVTRATSPSGRWEYTLYDAGEHPFIHALDTRAGEAVCIDLHGLEGRDLFGARLDLGQGGDMLTVTSRRDRPLVLVDTKTFEVSEPAPAAASEGSDDGGAPWALLALAAGGILLAAAGALALPARRRAAPPLDPELSDRNSPDPDREPSGVV